jgi:hypothetical protein
MTAPAWTTSLLLSAWMANPTASLLRPRCENMAGKCLRYMCSRNSEI